MKMLITLLFTLSFNAVWAQEAAVNTNSEAEMIEELDPFDVDVEKKLQEFDQVYEQETGLSPFMSSQNFFLSIMGQQSCYRQTCKVWAQVVRSTQRIYIYIDGQLQGQWPVSTGIKGRGTPNFDKHPNGRIYDRYTSVKFPGGNYNGLGNMPYAVFIDGGFAIHGTPQGNWKKLGQPASHGCIRVHPDTGLYFNRLVRQHGVSNVWITVQE